MPDPILIAPGQTLTVPDWDAILTQHGNLLPNAQPQNIGITDPLITGALAARPTLAAHVQQHPAYRYTMADGTTLVAMGTGQGDAVEILEYKPSAKFTAAQSRATAAQSKADDEWHTEGTPLPDGTTDNTRPIMARTVNGTKETRQPTAKELEDWNLAGQMTRNPGGKTDAQIAADTKTADDKRRADAGKTDRQPKTIGGKAYDYVTTQTKAPNGDTITEQHYEDPANPGVKIPTPMEAPTSAGVPNGSTTVSDATGKTTKKTTYLRPDGTEHEVVDTADVAKNTDTERDPGTGRTYEIVRNPDGTVKERREVTTTGPGSQTSYSYPDLKLAYGNIANEVMAISKDIYSRVGTGPGKITKEEADRLFKPIYDQAQMRVSEINGIVSTQKSVWDQQLSTANQRLDASTRMAGQAFGLARDVDKMAPGTGAVAGQMVWDMMAAQKDFAGSMGGLADPKLPGYLQAAMTMGPDSPGGTAGVPGPPAAPGGPQPPSGADVAAGAAATQAQSQAAFGGLGIPPLTAPQGGPMPNAAPLLPPPPPLPGQSPVPAYLDQAAGATDPGFYRDLPGAAQTDPGFERDLPAIPGMVPPVPMPNASGPGRGMPPPMPMPSPQPDPSATPPMPMPNVGGGITINIGHPGQQQQAGQQAYLQPAQQPQRPSLQDHQKEAAGALLGMGFDQDVIDHLWRQNTGRGLGG